MRVFTTTTTSCVHRRETNIRPQQRFVGGDAMCDAQADVPSAKRLRAQLAFKNSMVHGILQFTPRFDNDPSAGSPTETLLRLLLPQNDKVQWNSRDIAGGEWPTSLRS
ncbi:hypothetical protein Tco_0459534 [Tanacetum coccineum]